MASVPITAIEAWRDSAGVVHPTKDLALTVEVERALGRIGNGSESMTPGLARKIIENRDILMPLLEAFGPVLRADAPNASVAA